MSHLEYTRSLSLCTIYLCREEGAASPPGSPLGVGGQIVSQSHWLGMSHLEYTRSFSIFILCLENVSSRQIQFENNDNSEIPLLHIEDLTRVIISYEIY